MKYFIELQLKENEPISVNVEKLLNFFPAKDNRCMLVMSDYEAFSVLNTYESVKNIIANID